MVQLALDHIVIAAERLEDGVAHVEDTLGVAMAPGGKHPAMGTHNALLGLGDVYLEVIAIDPNAPPPSRPRWFDLDRFAGPPRLTNWVARAADLSAARAAAPPGTGAPMSLSRGDLTWTIAISEDGTLPFGGAFPGLIAWGDTPHPTTRLPDAGCRLEDWRVSHPDAEDLKAALARFSGGLEGWVHSGGRTDFRALVATPTGTKELR